MLVHLVLMAATLGTLAALLVIWHAVRKNLPQTQFERLVASIEETKLAVYDMGKQWDEFRRQLRSELDNLHERLEYLEERDRGRR